MECAENEKRRRGEIDNRKEKCKITNVNIYANNELTKLLNLYNRGKDL